jgi:hypothetical protein
MATRHGTDIINEKPRKDGDIDAIMYQINDTGDSSVASGDRYKHTINHTLGRVPVGCQIIMTDTEINMYVLEKDDNKIIVKFNAARADVTIRIW